METNNRKYKHMRKGHTDITMVLDRSGSMAHGADDTIGGVNKFLDDQKAAPGTATISLHQFDHEFDTLINAKDIKAAEHLSSKTFVPRGQTALLDAIGRSIKDTGSRLENSAEHDRAEKVVFVIITDGMENASHEFSHSQIKEMIEHQKTKYSWEFVFLGAELDAKHVASSIGINTANAMAIAGNAIGTHAMYASTSSNLRSFRRGQSASMSYSVGDMDAQVKAGLDPDLNKGKGSKTPKAKKNK